MKLIISFVLLSLTALSASSEERVQGYIRKDNTYVPPHNRTTADKNMHNNWTTKGNVNPYTGKTGTVDPYRFPETSGSRSRR